MVSFKRTLTRYRWWLVPLLILVLLVALWWHHRVTTAGGGGVAGRGHFSGGWGGGVGGLQTVVTAAKATTGDVPILFTALGTVVANQTVTVTSRVEGELQSVHFQEGQHVDKGQLLARIDPRPYQAILAQYQAALEQNRALLKSAQQQLARDRRLFAQKSLAEKDLETQVATVGQYAGAVKADQAQIQSARLNLDYTRITAPISGYAGLRQVDPGNLITAGGSNGIVTLTQTDPIAVTFSLPQADLKSVLPGLRAGDAMPVWALDQFSGATLAKGALKFISNEIDTATGTIKLKALFDNPKETLYPNQAVNVRLQTGELKNAVLIPFRAVQLSDAGKFVFVIKPDHTVVRRTVTTGPSKGEQVVIEKGVTAGEQVVTQGVDHLNDGSTVKIEPAQAHG